MVYSYPQAETGETVEIAFVDQDYTGQTSDDAAKEHGIKLEFIKLPIAKNGFVLLPRRWVVERRLVGHHGFVDWQETVNDCQRPWQFCIT